MSSKRTNRKPQSEEQQATYFQAKDIYLQLTPIQKPVLNFFTSNEISILTADPGCGKTFLALYYGIKGLLNGQFEHLILFKPCVQIQNQGFVPGDLKEKTTIFQNSFIDIVVKIVGKFKTADFIRSGKIIFYDIQTARGNTFKENSLIIGDEIQNLSLNDIYTLVTRFHTSNKMILTGDSFQTDIKQSGLKDFISIIQNIDGIDHMELDDSYQMRSKILVDITKNYKKFLNAKG